MAQEGDAGRTDDPAQPSGRIRLFGVDAADPRALPELTRQLPTDGTTLHRVPALANWARAEREPRRNPPGAFLAALGRLRGTRADAGVLAAVLDATAADLGISFEEVRPAADEPALPRHRWWTVGAWTVTLLAIAVPILGISAALLSGGMLVAIFAALLAVAAVALFVGFALARQAVAIRSHDAAAASLIATGVSGDEDEQVVAVPARNAAGVAATLRDRGIEAEARRIPPDEGTDSRS